MKRALSLSLAGLLVLLLAAPAWSQDRAAAQVRGWYYQFLNRPPDPSGLQYWSDALRNGVPPDEVLAVILDSEEYYAKSGYTPEGFVRKLYHDLLGRDPTSWELSQHVGHAAYSRFEVASALLRQYPAAWQSR
jgi:hypothetical protein